MATIALEAQARQELGKGSSYRLRKSGWIPGVIFGLRQAPLSIKVNQRLLEGTFNAPEKMHQQVELSLAEGEKMMVLLKDYQADIITRKFTHVDFIRIDSQHKVEISVPVRFTGRAAGLKQGGTLKPFLRSMKLICLPRDIPNIIEYDVTALEIAQVIHLSDIALPTGCELLPREGKLPLVTVMGKVEEEVVKEEAKPAAGAAPAAGAPAAAGAAPAAGKAAPAKAPAKKK